MRLSFFSILSFLIVSCSVFAFNPETVQANPFFAEEGKKKVAPPPVYAAGSNTFIKIQFEYRDKIAEQLRVLKEGKAGHVLFILLFVSFLYGIFHAAGPGHRKTIVFSLFIAQKVKWYEPACAGFLSAGVHAGSSIAVIGILYLVQEAVITISGTDDMYAYMEGITFVILALFSLIFIGYKIRSIVKINSKKTTPEETRKLYPLIIATSLVPCPGATMLLLIALYAGMIGTGILGVIAMSFGMGIIISSAGYLAYAGRKGLFLCLKSRESSLRTVSSYLEILSFVIIFLFSFLMAWPFLMSIIR